MLASVSSRHLKNVDKNKPTGKLKLRWNYGRLKSNQKVISLFVLSDYLYNFDFYFYFII